MDEPRGWYYRGYLPHIDAGCRPQFLTWHLADSMPAGVIDDWKEELAHLSDPKRKQELYVRIEKYLDAGHGSCILRNPVAGRITQETLVHDHGIRYTLHCWVVMPNHVHCLLTPLEGATLEVITRTNKSVSSTKIHKTLGGSGQLFQHDYFDRFIRDEQHFERVAKYIEWNAVKAKLTSDPRSWPFSSANPVARALLERG